MEETSRQSEIRLDLNAPPPGSLQALAAISAGHDIGSIRFITMNSPAAEAHALSAFRLNPQYPSNKPMEVHRFSGGLPRTRNFRLETAISPDPPAGTIH